MSVRRDAAKAGAVQVVKTVVAAARGGARGGPAGAAREAAKQAAGPIIRATVEAVRAAKAIRGANQAEKIATQTQAAAEKKRKEKQSKRR